MNNSFQDVDSIFAQLFERYPELNACRDSIMFAYRIIVKTYESNRCLFVAGNGGSAADSEHIIGELMKSFMAKRSVDGKTGTRLKELYGEEGARLSNALEDGLPAFSLPSLAALTTAISNDTGGEMIFAQSLYAASREGDAFLAISTSGNSKNLVAAIMTAKAKGLKSIGLTSEKHCRMDELCDIVIHVPQTETFKVQELHLPIYHALCAMLESHFFG